MLTLPTMKVWYDKILSGEKGEEYRSKIPYWEKRLTSAFGMPPEETARSGKSAEVLLRNGYNRKSPTIKARVHLRIGQGKREWGAVPGVDYFCLCIEDYEEVL